AGPIRTQSVAVLDTNDDGSISPIDALLLINELNRCEPASLKADVVEAKYVDAVFAIESLRSFDTDYKRLLLLNLVQAKGPATTLQVLEFPN
ncbi:MAG: hypothetical protein KDB27_25675, partial [Planctomycetales bacterium]|nr:hypothetical protein [Planctomycetales bacterium]